MARYTISHQPDSDYWHVRDNSEEVDETVASFTNEEQATEYADKHNEFNESLYGQAYDFMMRLDDKTIEELADAARKLRNATLETMVDDPNDQWCRVALKMAEIMDIMQEAC